MEHQINKVKFALTNMGLNEYQASALAHLMYLGETKATTLSKASGVPNARIYGVLDELSQKGLIIVRPGRPALYATLTPEEISAALVSSERESIREKLAVIESYRGEFREAAVGVYLKAGTSEPRRSLIRIVSVGDVSLEETRKLYRGAKENLLITTRAMEYLEDVWPDLEAAARRGIDIKILLRDPETLSEPDQEKQGTTMNTLRSLPGAVEIRFSGEVEIRGCIVDPGNDGKALFLVEEMGVPLFLREAAITAHPGVVKGLGSMFMLKWLHDSRASK